VAQEDPFVFGRIGPRGNDRHYIIEVSTETSTAGRRAHLYYEPTSVRDRGAQSV